MVTHARICTLCINVKVEEGLRESASVVGNLEHVRIETIKMEDELGQSAQ